MIKDAWHWYRQYPALWLYSAMRFARLPFKWCMVPLPWCGVAYCANSFAGYRMLETAKEQE